MGSTGLGRFGGYSGKKEEGIRCGEVENPIRLDDVSTSNYVNIIGSLPPVGDEIRVMDQLVNKRVGIQHIKTGLCIGFLPIDYNYLYEVCMKKGFVYSGIIIESGIIMVPVVMVELHA